MPLSLIRSNEIISPSRVAVGKYAAVQCDPSLTSKRLYLFLDTVTTGDFVLFGRVLGLDANGGVMAEYDANLYSQTNGQIILPKSVGTIFAAGGSAVGDSYVLQLSAPFNAALPTVVVQPLRVTLAAGGFVYQLDDYAGLITGFRVWLGVLSSDGD